MGPMNLALFLLLSSVFLVVMVESFALSHPPAAIRAATTTTTTTTTTTKPRFAFGLKSSRDVATGTTTQLMALPKEELIRLTKEFLANPGPDWWSEDFVFRGPVIGPLGKKDMVATLNKVGSNAEDAFPDIESNAFGFTADDPIEPNRVWYFVRPRGTFTNAFEHPTLGRIEPTGEALIAPPEARSVVWNDEGKIRHLTVGYVMDRFTGDTTRGMGAVFGLYAHMGVLDIDGSVGSPVLRFIQWLATVLPGDTPQSFSKEEDIPAWWTDKRRGAEA